MVQDSQHDTGQKTIDDAIDAAYAYILDDPFFVVLQRDIPCGDAADDDGQCLCRRIAAHSGDDRHGGCQGNDLRNRVFKKRNRGGSQESRHQIDEQPGQAHLDRLEDCTVHFLFFVDTAEFQDIFGIFLFDDIDDIIDGDDSDDSLSFIDDRDGVQVIFGYDTGNIFLVRFRFDRNDIVLHDIFQFVIIFGNQKISQGYGPNELLFFIRNVKDADFFRPRSNFLDFFQSLADGQSAAHGNVFGGHDAAGTRLRISQEIPDDLLVARLHEAHQFFPAVCRQIAQDIDDIVLRHMLEHLEDPVDIKEFHDADLKIFIGLLDDFSHLLRRNQLIQEKDVAVRDLFQGNGDIYRVGFLQKLCYSLFIPLIQGSRQFILHPFFQLFLLFFILCLNFLVFFHVRSSPSPGKIPCPTAAKTDHIPESTALRLFTRISPQYFVFITGKTPARFLTVCSVRHHRSSSSPRRRQT